MLTPAQQKVRQELEELQVKGLLKGKKPDPTVRKKPMTKWFYFVMAAFLLACSLLVNAFYNDQKHEKIDRYLNKIHTFDQQSDKLLKEVTENTAEVEVQKLIAKQTILLKKTKILHAPVEFNNYHLDTIAVMEQRLVSLNNPSQTNLIKLEVKKELAKDSLLKAFKREKIPYKENGDGIIQYWLQSKSYTY